jgi:hypothetical protein
VLAACRAFAVVVMSGNNGGKNATLERN